MDKTEKEKIAQENIETAKRIISLLGVDRTAMTKGLADACDDCEHYGPPDGKPCMSLRLALDMGIEYTPPDWCRDKPMNPQ